MYALVYIHLEIISKYCYNNNIYNNNRIYDGCISVVKWIQEVLKGQSVIMCSFQSSIVNLQRIDVTQTFVMCDSI